MEEAKFPAVKGILQDLTLSFVLVENLKYFRITMLSTLIFP